ncbi:hypothetical protein G6F62_005754 [Rhizopus arrhizus]|uniref:BHLH domain-containing protein n=1 Tax=Rhizopus oryzae TaxID=64495 RepID=A0A9P7BR75_RHIOR|nr:hypothetical protein G6F23_007019 [Rhizopus arrhizus]KAG0761533.1 hypothetical protein G6F24_007482 [Rhizopus arrhizus]KAG0794175.1 hypothetical protein G6F21_003073 [Rhizopus arrhizus]KAG0795121.1 hypothetical protein G6F22_005184 [Rhizopus arrhizus]KAG0810095.1 hypothetical protein G6F20_008247 [Rhizopus arrhizus]
MNSERKKSTGSISSDMSSTRQRTSSYPNGISFSNSVDESQHRELAYMEKRSAHNALERQRREGLNSKYQELAHVLPTLQEVKRPSKNMIVTKSLEFVSKAKEREDEYKDELKALQKEHAQLQRQAKLSKSRKDKQRQNKLGLQPILPVNPSSSSSRLKPQVRDLSPVISQKRQREPESETVQKRSKPDTRRSSASSSCATVQSAAPAADLSVHSALSYTSSVGDEQLYYPHEDPSYTPLVSSSPPVQVSSIPAIRMPVVHTGTQQQQQQQQLLNLDMFLQNDNTFDDSNHLWNYPPY